MIFDTLQDGIAFYYKYANECGFKVRSSTTKSQKNKDDPTGKGVTLIKYLLCSKEGYVTNNKKSGKQVEGACLKRKTVKRVGCPAKIKFRFCNDGKYMVYCLYESHSHPFSTPITRQVTKHEVGLNFAHKKFIFDNSKLNIGAVMSDRIMKELCGGFQNNLEQKVKTSKGGYYFDYCVDESRHLTRVFWADAIGRRDYQLFWDSLSFDSTYDTNKYSLVFCPFTGVDNHKRCVKFCAALLSKGDIDSFVWLFQTFLKFMGREPSCIITDQDPAMGIAIEKVFTKTKHRLCMWHIMRKVPEKVGTDFCKETDFLKKLSAVVWDREIDPHVFVDGWNSVMEEFNLVDHEWFAYMFKIKHLWIPAYFRDLFMGGILCSTSRSEGENSFFCNFTNPHVTCVEFFVRYETALDAQRHEQDEFSLYGDSVEFSVIVDHEKRKKFDVNFDLATYESSCTCRIFESQGVLCRHILFVMKGKCVRRIPDAYILNRWRKDVLKKAYVIDVALDDASKYDKKKQLMISKNNPENAPSSIEVKDADIQVLVGSNKVDVNVLPPNQCLNKGSARSSKRLKSAKKIATEEKSKKGRTCRACGQSGVSHDSRNCPNK
ncbi:protein FAR1-RELATED SEQUENCE 5-like [Chenopodium quinoa]|uniref:protein FAR1-RELATED SEQUENCE 5-like n=1 Tax=Chenopodium quinoa TaxID=63459 RepID=UPI000B781D95|nr:protein FAR1-RELATED SEQUENCE 5-like [Chenopodium quinoa]